MPKYLSGRVKRTPQGALSTDRSSYLALSEAEPNLGDPTLLDVEANLPVGEQYQIISVIGSPGKRYWIPRGGGLIPGSISVYDEGTLTPIGGINSITQLNFVGSAITAQGYLNLDGSPGIAVTIKVFAPGNNQEIIFNTNNDFSSSSKLKFDSSTSSLYAGDRLFVGAGGTVITTTSNGLVGIGTSNPSQELHVQGDLRITGTIYDYFNNPGSPTFLIGKNNFGGLSWIDPSTIRAGAGGTYQSVQFHNSVGLVDGAGNFVYDEVNGRVGIGSTKPKVLLDVLGVSSFTGPTQISQLNVTGVTTIQTLAVTGTSTTRNLQVTGVTTLGFLTGTNAYFTGIVTAAKFIGNVDIVDLNVTGVGTINTLKVLGLTTTRDLQVFQSTNLNNLNVSGITTFGSQLNVNNLSVTGVATVDNIKLDTNTVSTLNGNLILDSIGGTTQINDSLYITDTTDSSNKDTGSIITEGGVGIEKNLNVGGITRLATQGGITTTGGDLYVNGNLFVGNDIFYDEISGRRAVFSEYLETKDFRATGISTLNTLNVSGIATFASNATFTSNATFNGNVILGNSNTDLVTITSNVNSSIFPSADNTYNLGSASLRWNNIYATTINGSVLGNADTASKLQTPRYIDISGDVLGLGIGVSFDGSTNITIPTELTTTGVTSATYGSSTQIGRFSVDSKGRITSASNVNIDFSGAFVSRAGYADTAGIATYAVNAGVATNIAGRTSGAVLYQVSPGITTGLIIGTNGFVLQSNGSAPVWVNPTTIPVGNAIYADKAGIATYADKAGISTYSDVAGIATYANSAGISTNVVGGTSGALLYQSNTNQTTNLPIGSNGLILQSNGSSPVWVNPITIPVGNAIYADKAGIATYANKAGIATYADKAGIATYANSAGIATNVTGGTSGALLYQSNANVTTNLPIGSNGLILQSNGSVPVWVNPTTIPVGNAIYADKAGIATYADKAGIATYANSSGISSYADRSGISTNVVGGTPGALLYQSSANVTTNLPIGSNGLILQSNGSVPVWVNPATIPTSNAVYADKAGIATYADKSGIATYANSSGIATYAQRAGISTNVAGGTAGAILYQSNSNTTTSLPIGSNGLILQSNGSVPVWVNSTSIPVGNASYADKAGIATYADSAGIATNLAGGSIYNIPYQTAANKTAFITTTVSTSAGYILQYNASSPPSWVSPTNIIVNNALTANDIVGGNKYQILYQDGPSSTNFISTSTAQDGWILRYNSNSAPSWISPSTVSVNNSAYADVAGIATLAKNLQLNYTGRLVQQSGPNITSVIPSGNSGEILRSLGDGVTPVWTSVSEVLSIGGINITVVSTNYTGPAQITGAGLTVTVSSNSNAYGKRWVSQSTPTTSEGYEGDVWYQVT